MFYVMAVLAALIASLGHIFFKKFALRTGKLMSWRFFDSNLAIGIAFFSTSVILSIIVLKFIDFSAFYSFTALNYLFISILSKMYLKERLDKYKIIGILIIIVGILAYNL